MGFARPAQDGSHAGRVGVGNRDVLYVRETGRSVKMADRVRTEPVNRTYVQVQVQVHALWLDRTFTGVRVQHLTQTWT
jgi:hypothetical protein